MEYINTYTEGRGLRMTGIHFEAGEEKREKRWAETMNRYYKTLEDAVTLYAEEYYTKMPASRYVCSLHGETEQDTICVTVRLAHRIPPEKTRRKVLLHVWKNGYLVKENLI